MALGTLFAHVGVRLALSWTPPYEVALQRLWGGPAPQFPTIEPSGIKQRFVILWVRDSLCSAGQFCRSPPGLPRWQPSGGVAGAGEQPTEACWRGGDCLHVALHPQEARRASPPDSLGAAREGEGIQKHTEGERGGVTWGLHILSYGTPPPPSPRGHSHRLRTAVLDPPGAR